MTDIFVGIAAAEKEFFFVFTTAAIKLSPNSWMTVMNSSQAAESGFFNNHFLGGKEQSVL